MASSSSSPGLWELRVLSFCSSPSLFPSHQPQLRASHLMLASPRLHSTPNCRRSPLPWGCCNVPSALTSGLCPSCIRTNSYHTGPSRSPDSRALTSFTSHFSALAPHICKPWTPLNLIVSSQPVHVLPPLLHAQFQSWRQSRFFHGASLWPVPTPCPQKEIRIPSLRHGCSKLGYKTRTHAKLFFPSTSITAVSFPQVKNPTAGGKETFGKKLTCCPDLRCWTSEVNKPVRNSLKHSAGAKPLLQSWACCDQLNATHLRSSSHRKSSPQVHTCIPPCTLAQGHLWA